MQPQHSKHARSPAPPGGITTSSSMLNAARLRFCPYYTSHMHTKRKAESETYDGKSHHAKNGFQNIWDDGPEAIANPLNVRKTWADLPLIFFIDSYLVTLPRCCDLCTSQKPNSRDFRAKMSWLNFSLLGIRTGMQ